MTRSVVVALVGLVLSGSTAAPAEPPSDGDRWLTRPVDDRTFATYLEFFAYDKQLPLELQVTRSDEDQGLRTERLSYQSTPGVRVTALLVQPPGQTAARRRAVVLLHGGGPRGKDNPTVTAISTLLARAGFMVLAIDMQYFGERSTSLLTTFAEQEKHDRLYNQPSVYLAWVTQAAKDVKRGFDLLVEQRSADARRVALVGFSRGAILASIVGGCDGRFAAVGLLFGGHFDALETSHLPAACPANYVGRIAPRPLLMVNGTRDSDMVRDRSVEPLYRLARRPKEIVWTDGGHGFMTEEHRAAIVQWLQNKLK
jgi:dipeptidyl aminopeptidase/acylaminoacyl peptidase